MYTNDDLKYERDTLLIEERKRSMTNQTPTSEQIQTIVELRNEAKALMMEVVRQCPEGRARSVALTHIEDALMWAVKAVVLG